MFTEDSEKKASEGGKAPILSKYKAPMNKAEESKKEEDLLKAKRIAKEKIRLQGRKIPKLSEQEYERGLMLIATKGVV